MKIENLDELKDIIIEHQNLIEFNFEKDNYSIFYNEDKQIWFAECLDLESENIQSIEIIEDKKKGIIMEEDIYLFDIYSFTVKKLNEFKKVINL